MKILDPIALAMRYANGAPPLNHDESEMLLAALYMESKNNGGIAFQAREKLISKGNYIEVLPSDTTPDFSKPSSDSKRWPRRDENM
jgi:hypothetical protein